MWVLSTHFTKEDVRATTYMKRCSTSHVTRERKRKQWNTTSLSWLLQCLKSKTDHTKYWTGYGAIRILNYCLWESKMALPFGRQFRCLSYKIKQTFLYSAILILNIYPKDLKACSSKCCKQRFKVALVFSQLWSNENISQQVNE